MRVAAVQLTSTADFSANLETADRLTRAAAADGAQLVVLPEKWSALGRGEDLVAGAQPLDGPAITWARETARELGIDLVAGSISERVADEQRAFATRRCTSAPTASCRRAIARCTCSTSTVDGTVYHESEHEEPGDELVVSPTAGGVELGLSICYDIRFPEIYRILAIRGARVFTVPAAFTVPTTRDHWEILLRARAIEDQAFVVAANQIGEHAPGLRSGGRSMIVDPWGIVLAHAADRECHVVADLDLEAQARIRRDLPALANRRPRAYRWPTEVRA